LAPDTPVQGVTTAEIVCHPSGKWLYVSNRGCDTITQFALQPDGRLTWVRSVPSVAKFPRQFTVDPTGRWMIVAGQKDDRIVVLKIDPLTGHLTPTNATASLKAPTCVLFWSLGASEPPVTPSVRHGFSPSESSKGIRVRQARSTASPSRDKSLAIF
jgi:6-phosphogluconolactonase (cycloisomerase 2 family)